MIPRVSRRMSVTGKKLRHNGRSFIIRKEAFCATKALEDLGKRRENLLKKGLTLFDYCEQNRSNHRLRIDFLTAGGVR